MSDIDRTRGGTGTVAAAAGRRVSALLLVAFGAASLVVINVWPGWASVPFLTADAEQVIGLVNLSIVLGIAVNLGNAAFDRAWLRSTGEVITSAVGAVVCWRVLEVFPFRFAAGGLDWAVLVRVLLWVALVGSVIGVVASVVKLGRVAGSGS
jgi:hypothetical protein